MTSWANDRRDFLDEVRDEEYRHEFVSEHVTVGLAFQINLLRQARGWTQEELARRCDMAQESSRGWRTQTTGDTR